MTINIIGRKITLKDSFKDLATKEIGKLSKFFGDDADATITVSVVKGRQTVEATIKSQGMIYRAESTSDRMEDGIKRVTDDIIRKIRKNKTKMEKKLRAGSFEDIVAGIDNTPVEEEGIEIVRTKRFPIKPLDPEEAALQLDLLGHQFYMFRNIASGEVNVVYKRKDGGYGLIEPEE